MKRTKATSSLDAHVARWALPLSLVATAALPACNRASAEIEPPARATTSGATNASASVPQKVLYHASWAEYYTSIKDLKAHADIAVVGTVSSIAPAEELTPNGPVYSTVTLDVQHSIWSRTGTAAPTSVTFDETGGTYQGVTYQIEDEPLYQVGDHVLMFFTATGQGQYRVTGGPTGCFAISGGTVKPRVKDGVQVGVGSSESSFETNVQND